MDIGMFERLPKEKQEKILDACLTEFAAYGFDAASTNRIVKQAGIPKGSLFKYFGDKKQLFLYLSKKIGREKDFFVREQMKSVPSDFLEAITYIALKELEYYRVRPDHAHLIRIITSQPLHPVYRQVMEIFNHEQSVGFEQIMAALPREALRDDINFADVTHVFSMFFHSLNQRIAEEVTFTSNELESKLEQDKLIEELHRFFDIVRYGIYKKESRHDG